MEENDWANEDDGHDIFEDDGHDIFNEESGWDLRKKLDSVVSTCKHCTGELVELFDWEPAGKNVSVEDWFMD